MSYINEFKSIVTLSKRNHRYYGPTESWKMKDSLTEIACDLNVIFNQINSINNSIDALASGYLMPSGSLYSLSDLKRDVYMLEDKINQRIYIQADQAEILE